MDEKQPVYIRGDFVNCYVELTDDQVKELVEFAKKLHNAASD